MLTTNNSVPRPQSVYRIAMTTASQQKDCRANQKEPCGPGKYLGRSWNQSVRERALFQPHT